MSKEFLYIGLDDTDNLESGGTGNLARQIARKLNTDLNVISVTRHQLLIDPRVPYTAKNSCAAICIKVEHTIDMHFIFELVKSIVIADHQPHSDPGVCLARYATACHLIKFGERTKQELISQDVARALAFQTGARLEGLSGTQDGVIGALAAVGLAASGMDGRYIMIGRTRELSGLQPIQTIIEAGIPVIKTLDGSLVEDGMVLCDKIRPACRDHKPVLFVEWHESYWLPLKLD